jgi:CDP-diacylglycerol--serine O-phosphatidyltransferase
VISALCALYLIGAVLRLARFTVKTDEDESDHHTFEGLPSPAAAGVIVSAIIFIFDGRRELWLSPESADSLAIMILRSLPVVAALIGVLMVSRVPYVHVVQRYVGHRTGVTHFVNVVVVIAIVLVFHEWSLFLLSGIYVLGGLGLSLRSRITGRSVLESLPEPWEVEESSQPDNDDGSQP